jgi:hypothetical protein
MAHDSGSRREDSLSTEAAKQISTFRPFFVPANPIFSLFTDCQQRARAKLSKVVVKSNRVLYYTVAEKGRDDRKCVI